MLWIPSRQPLPSCSLPSLQLTNMYTFLSLPCCMYWWHWDSASGFVRVTIAMGWEFTDDYPSGRFAFRVLSLFHEHHWRSGWVQDSKWWVAKDEDGVRFFVSMWKSFKCSLPCKDIKIYKSCWSRKLLKDGKWQPKVASAKWQPARLSLIHI